MVCSSRLRLWLVVWFPLVFVLPLIGACDMGKTDLIENIESPDEKYRLLVYRWGGWAMDPFVYTVFIVSAKDVVSETDYPSAEFQVLKVSCPLITDPRNS